MRKAQTSLTLRLVRLPLILVLFGVVSVLMLIPAGYASYIDEHHTARVFLYSAMLGFIVFGLLALALGDRDAGVGPLGPLMSLLAGFLALPVALAIPFYEAVQTTTFLNAYVEMTSAITTTGATLFDAPGRLNDALHLWRALVGWFGGLLMWIAAWAILAPLNLGGFEITARAEPGRREQRLRRSPANDMHERLLGATATFAPIYVSLTGLLWLLLSLLGEAGLVALIHSMSIMSTSGISSVGGVETASAGMAGEVVMFLFMSFALSRLTFSKDTITSASGGLAEDPEFRIALILLIIVPAFLFARHWLGAFDLSVSSTVFDALRALWGSLFTVMSFVSTTGFTSAYWTDAQGWSGLDTPGLMLMGLALVGGGVATTAGGVKLLRVFALYVNGRRELERLLHPSSVSGAGHMARRLQKDGAFIAWIFFMLFALSLATITIALTAFGVSFEEAVVLSVAGLSTTGPLLEFGGDSPIDLLRMEDGAKIIFAVAMVVGRLETLAIIALLTPDLWRN